MAKEFRAFSAASNRERCGTCPACLAAAAPKAAARSHETVASPTTESFVSRFREKVVNPIREGLSRDRSSIGPTPADKRSVGQRTSTPAPPSLADALKKRS
jgi:hypothetical protein